jgi:hypothetical protein
MRRVGVALVLCCVVPGWAPSGSRPNVLMIVVDDLRRRLESSNR